MMMGGGVTGPDAAAAVAAFVQDHNAGFDICHFFDPVWYNRRLDDEGLLDLVRLPTCSSSTTTNNSTLTVLVGNTKHLWPLFLQWCRSKQQQQEEEQQLPTNPLNTYCQEQIQRIVAKHFTAKQACINTSNNDNNRIFWSNSLHRDTLISMQRVAAVSGLAYLDTEGTLLSVHPVFGPWLSYRAVVVVSMGHSNINNNSYCHHHQQQEQYLIKYQVGVE